MKKRSGGIFENSSPTIGLHGHLHQCMIIGHFQVSCCLAVGFNSMWVKIDFHMISFAQ